VGHAYRATFLVPFSFVFIFLVFSFLFFWFSLSFFSYLFFFLFGDGVFGAGVGDGAVFHQFLMVCVDFESFAFNYKRDRSLRHFLQFISMSKILLGRTFLCGSFYSYEEYIKCLFDAAAWWGLRPVEAVLLVLIKIKTSHWGRKSVIPRHAFLETLISEFSYSCPTVTSLCFRKCGFFF